MSLLLNMNISNPTIISGIMGIAGSILGAIVGAFITALLLMGKIRFLVLENELNFYTIDGVLGIPSYKITEETKEDAVLDSDLFFKLLITNSKRVKYSLSNLQLVFINKKNKFNKTYILKDNNDNSEVDGHFYIANAESYIIDEHSNAVLYLSFLTKGNELFINYKTSKTYLNYIDYKGKKRSKRIYLNFNDCNMMEKI